MGLTPSVEFQRAEDLAWRLAPDRVLVRRITNAEVADDDAADLFGAAALVWIAAEHSSTVESLADETELDPVQVADTVDALLTGEWIVQRSPAHDGRG